MDYGVTMKGYVGTKKIKAVYVGSTAIYRDAPPPKVEVITFNQNQLNYFASKGVVGAINDVPIKVGSVFYKGDVFTLTAPQGSVITRALYYSNTVFTTDFTLVSDTVAKTGFENGYAVGRYNASTGGFVVVLQA